MSAPANTMISKVIATLGPASANASIAEAMAKEGASGFRINMSHGNEKSWDMLVSLCRGVEEKTSPLALIADIEGPRIRISSIEPVSIRPGQRLVFGLHEGVRVNKPAFFQALEEGDWVLVDDGRVELVVRSVYRDKAVMEVVKGDILEPRKGVVVVGKEFDLPPVSEEDARMLRFVAARHFSHVLASFVRNEDDVRAVRDHLEDLGRSDIWVFSKIETPSGVRNLQRILRVSDGIVIARGDLGMHFPLEEIPLLQAKLIESSIKAGKPVVLATELLTSMRYSPRPTRSEVLDVYEGVVSGVDAFLLTGETAVGKYPVEAVRWVARIVSRARSRIKPGAFAKREETPIDRLAEGVVKLVESIGASLVIYSRTGSFARRVSSNKPLNTIYVGVPNERAARKVALLWASVPVVIGEHEYEEGLERTLRELSRRGLLPRDAPIVEAAWSREGGTYLIRVRNLLEAL